MPYKPIKDFTDLELYQSLYKAMLLVHKEIIPKLPKHEKYDLCDQMSRASKSAPALVAEGFAKRFQILHWSRYLTDVIGECNEMIHHISVCLDLYGHFLDKKICDEVIDLYDKSRRQATKLGNSWNAYHKRKRNNKNLK